MDNSISSLPEFNYYGVLISTAVLVISSTFLFRRWTTGSHRQLPPAPSNMNFLSFMKRYVSTDGPEFVLQLSRSLGDVYRFPGITNPCCVLVGNPDLARQILEDPKSQKPFEMYNFFDNAVGGESFFVSNGPRGLHVRKSTMAAFAPSNIKVMASIVESVVEKWIETRLEPLFVQTKTPLDFDAEMMLVTSEIIAKAAFEYDLNTDERLELSQKLSSILDVFVHKGLNPLEEYFGFLFPYLRKATRDAKQLTAKFGHRVLMANRNDPNANPSSLASLIVNDLDYQNDEERARDVMLYFFAGFETTSHSIAWTLLELARDHSEQIQLQTALQEFDKGKERSNLQHCQQLKNVIRESLRLHTPVALGSVRYATHDMSVPNSPNGAIIPKGSLCFVVFHMLFRNLTIFGSTADSFDPSRWENPTEEMQRAYLPFAAGKRNCQGQALANLELQTVISKLMQRYKLELVEEGHPSYMVTLKPMGSKILVTKH